MRPDRLAAFHDLAEKTVFVSGGATGIGSDLVRAFADQGARVAFVDIDAAAGHALAEDLAGAPRPPAFAVCDVTDTAALAAAIDAAQALDGRLDVLVNNAANDTRHSAETATEADFDRIVAVNLRHQFFAAQRAFHWMKPTGRGSIIHFGSIAPRLGIRDLPIYGACKSAVEGLTRTMARAFGDHGVRVNGIAPGAILTPRQLALWISPEDEARITADQCLHRRLIGADIAPTVLFLASDASSAITSQVVTVDAGLAG